MKPPPASKKAVKNVLDPEERKLLREAIKSANPNTMRARLLKGQCVQEVKMFIVSRSYVSKMFILVSQLSLGF